MPNIGIRELKAHVSRIIHQVKEEGVRYIITRHGQPIAVISAIEDVQYEMTSQNVDQIWDDLEKIGNQIAQVATHSVTKELSESRR